MYSECSTNQCQNIDTKKTNYTWNCSTDVGQTPQIKIHVNGTSRTQIHQVNLGIFIKRQL